MIIDNIRFDTNAKKEARSGSLI